MMEATKGTTPNVPERTKITIEDLMKLKELFSNQDISKKDVSFDAGGIEYNAFHSGEYRVNICPNGKYKPWFPNLLKTATI